MPLCPQQTEPSSFLIIRMSSLGDILNALPTLVAMRRKFPHARIGWVVEDRFAAALEGQPYIDELFVVPLRSWLRDIRRPTGFARSWRALQALKKRLRHAQYDATLDIQGIVKSDVIVAMAGCKTRVSLSDSHYNRSSNIRVEPGPTPAATRFLAAAQYFGAENPDLDYCFFMREEDHLHAENLVLGHDFGGASGPLVALNPGASASWRQWPGASFAEVAEALRAEKDARIVILGGPNEVPLAQAIAERYSGKPLVAAGQCTIKQLGALLQRSDLLITADTGPMHLAAAVHTPTVSFFGSADPNMTGPIGDFHTIVIASGPACVPCLNHPNCKGYPCLDRITPEAVIRGALIRLAMPRPLAPQVP